MRKTSFDWLVYSFVGHFVLLVLFILPNSVNTPKSDIKIEVEIKEIAKNAPKSGTPDKPLKSHEAKKPEKAPEAAKPIIPDENPEHRLLKYSEQVKALVDPVYIRKIYPYKQNNIKFYTEVLIFLDSRGMILNVRLTQSSGYPEIDQVVLNTFKEVGTLLPPPAIVVEKGLIWEFSN